MEFNLLSFADFVNEQSFTDNDLFKIYLAIDPETWSHWSWTKEFAGDKMFVQITPDNYKDITINKNFPVLSYNKSMIEILLKKKLIKIENIYNLPEHMYKSSKAEFHKIVSGDENVPETAYTQEEAIKIGLPIIAKPKDMHSGLGIQIFKTEEEFNNADHSKFDVYSKYIDKKSEHRLYNFKGEPFFWTEREPINDKAKTGDGEADGKMKFRYIRRDIDKLPEKFKVVVKKFCKMFSELPYICFDIMVDKDDKIYVIESNLQPGVQFDVTVQAYRVIFKDFYGRDVDEQTDKKLEEISEFLNKETLKYDEKGQYKLG